MSKWIKISEQKPTAEIEVLIIPVDNEELVSASVALVVAQSDEYLYFNTGFVCYELDEISYWMPLPEPPKGE